MHIGHSKTAHGGGGVCQKNTAQHNRLRLETLDGVLTAQGKCNGYAQIEL